MKSLRIGMIILALGMAFTPVTASARGRGGGGGGFRGGSGGFRGWSGGGRGYRPFSGGHWGWAPWWGVGVGFGYPGYIWPYGVPWVIYPAVVPGYIGEVPDAVPIQPPAPAVVLHAGEVTSMDVGLRLRWQCDSPRVLVPSLESSGDASMALVLRGNAAGEANCIVGDGETMPLRVHVVVLPAVAPPVLTPPPPAAPPPAAAQPVLTPPPPAAPPPPPP